MASLASESTPQATTLRNHFSDLIRAIQDPVLLAVDLYSAEIITQTLLERVSTATALTRTDKTSLLLGAVSDQTVVSPRTFDNFLNILSEDHGPSLPDIVEKIKESMLGSQGMYSLASSPGLSQSLSRGCGVPDFSPRLRDNIWEWPGNEPAMYSLFCNKLSFMISGSCKI